MLVGVAVVAGRSAPQRDHGAPAGAPPALRAAAAAAIARVQFVPNVGQWDEQVRFAALGETTGWLHDDGFTLRFERWQARSDDGRPREQAGCIVRTHFLGAAAPEFASEGAVATRRHFLIGDTARHRTDVPAWERVVMRGVHPGIDVAFRALPAGRRGAFEYDLLLAPGADLACFVARCDGVTALRIDAAGRLCASLAGMGEAGELVQEAPIAWQLTPDGQRPLRVAFRLLGDDCYGFAAADLDPAFAAVVDPGIVWGTFLGGGSTDTVNGLAWRQGVGVWVTGLAGSTDFPVTPGAFQTIGGVDAYVARLAEDGQTLQFATYLGGSSTDEARAIALGPGDAATVVGVTRSTDFPVTPGALQPFFGGSSPFVAVGDGFVTRVGPSGDVLEASTYLGGYFDDVAEAVAIDSTGAAVVAGWTSSHDFPIGANAAQSLLGGPAGAQSDGFVVRIASDKQVLLGGTFAGGPYNDQFLGLALDPITGDVIVGGYSLGPGYPTTPGALRPSNLGGADAIVTRFNAQGSAFVFSTYLGGSGFDSALAIHRDRHGQIWVGGTTQSADLMTTPGAPWPQRIGAYDGFVSALAPDGQSLVFSTYLGGSGNDRVRGIATMAGDVVVVGEAGPGFPLTPDAVQVVHSGGVLDAFLLRLVANGGTWNVGYGTYLGGAGQDVLRCIALDDRGIAMLGGWTFSPDLVLQPPGFQPQMLGVENGMVVKFDLLANLGEGLRASSEPPVVTRSVGDGERELLSASLENLTDRQLHVDGLRVLVAGAGDGAARLASVRCVFERDGVAPMQVGGPAPVLADDRELALVLAGAALPAFGTARLRVIGTVAGDPAGFSAEIAAVIAGVDAWTLRADGGGQGPQVRVEAPGRVAGPVLVLGELPGDSDRDGVRTVVDVRRQIDKLGGDDPAVDTDGDGRMTLVDVDATRELVLGRASVFAVPSVWQVGSWHTLRGAFPGFGAVQATLGGQPLVLGAVTPRELTLFVPASQPSGTQEFVLTIGGRVVWTALVLVQ